MSCGNFIAGAFHFFVHFATYAIIYEIESQ